MANLGHYNSGYRGNAKLKQLGYTRAYTKLELDELEKCAADPIYFIKNYVKIINVDGGIIPFDMWPFQENMIRTMNENRFVIAKFPRQVGKTATTFSYILWYILFNQDKSVAVLAHKAAAARKILGKLQRSYEELPDFLKQNVKTWNKGSIELANGCTVIADATTPATIRGDAINILFLDEFAFIENNIASDFYESAYPTISSGKTTKLFISSTPKGMNNFHKIYTDAKEGKNSFIPLEIKWNDPPGRDDAWRKATIADIGQEKFDQEFGAEFLGSSSTLISGYKLEEIRAACVDPLHIQNGVRMWEIPKNDHRYLITVDVSRGVNKDYSAFSVIDVTDYPMTQVATYYDNTIDPLMFPTVILSAAYYYNDAYILVEINDNGQQIADMLKHDLEYENVLMITKKLKRGGQTIGVGFKKNLQYGLKQTTATKKIGCVNLKTLIERDRLKIYDRQTYEELTTFIQVNQSYEADEGKHDDLVMTLVLLGWAIGQDFFKKAIGKSARADLAEELEEQVMPFGIWDTGISKDPWSGGTFQDDEGLIWTPVY